MPGALGWLAARDPGWFALHRAIRAAVVCPAAFAIGSQLVGDARVATFAAFGSFALLLFVDFSSNRSGRLAAYSLLGVAGCALIALGTITSRPSWLAVAAMAVVGFAILFAGVLSSVIAAASRAALLAFILAVMLPGGASDIPLRLAGWGIAFAISVPAALFVWPPRSVNQLRMRTADTCRALAAMLHPVQPPAAGGDPLVAVLRATDELQVAFRASTSRPVTLSTGGRLLMRLVDELEWLSTAVVNACADAPEQWPEVGRRLRLACAEALEAAARVLGHDGSGPTREGCDRLEDCLTRLEACRREIAEETLHALASDTQGALVGDGTGRGPAPGEFDRPLYAAHELGYAVWLTGRTVSVIAAADARSWLARLFGRRPAGGSVGELAAAEQIASGHMDSHSVWLQNSLRGAAGLAAAVLIADVSSAQHGFWVVLGALSVLRSNALSTGTIALRALAGTVAGFVVGALLLQAIGTSPDVLWAVLPVVVLLAGFAPNAISFTAGQAAFTIVVIVLFNIIAPAGWTIGLLRVEDVAIGCAASVVAGVLFWPRGATAALGGSLADGYRTAGAYLRAGVGLAAGRNGSPASEHEQARAAGWRLDDALRQYLAERGGKQVPLQSVTALVNGAARLRLAGEAIVALHGHENVPPSANGLAEPVRVLVGRADTVASWYDSAATALTDSAAPLPTAGDRPDQSFLDTVLPAITNCSLDQATHAERLLWAGQYLGDVDRLRDELTAPLAAVRATQRRPWWLR